ncbi:MAG TPA: type II toxin-antitoxin system RelE/ParE family toxin [Polyangia bacterium]|jgi:plasmid stabilization system protein ParE|nr:type II toxin-antitoxin system RelE/ParE family toxin [Polyangia bacterium]
MSIRFSRVAARDLRQQLAYLTERNPQAARQLAADLDELLRALDRSAFEGQEKRLLSGRVVHAWPLPPLGIYYQRRGAELYVVRIYHQARRPITKP